MCGDYTIAALINLSTLGSPLHVRGLLTPAGMWTSSKGITPACAGTTTRYLHLQRFCRDHPCMCGDYCRLKTWRRCNPGSPLHVRGLQRIKKNDLKKARITPACAGTTLLILFELNFFQDHPCMCGDYMSSTSALVFKSGSPLHVRGLLFF